ncbi:MAG: SIMPL domain-containing protein, partial [bacterium]
YQVDLVDVQFSISMRDNDAESSKRKHDRIMVKVNKYLKEKEYPEGVLLLQNSVLQRQKSTTGKSGDDFYLARSAYLMRTDRVQDTNALQAELVEIGVDEIQSVTLFSSKQRQLEGDARKFALEDAIKKADLTAKTLGLKLGKPVSMYYEAPSITFDSSIEVIVKVTFSYQADTNVQETVPADAGKPVGAIR